MPGDQHHQSDHNSVHQTGHQSGQQPGHSSNRKRRFTISRSTRGIALLLCLGTLAGVLIWAKLRLVTDIPRSAYADPKERQADGDDPAGGDAFTTPDGRGSDAEAGPKTGSGDAAGSSAEHP
ncbi:MAG: hypothetical protein WD114_06825 [Phycisphaerales bacterium]